MPPSRNNTTTKRKPPAFKPPRPKSKPTSDQSAPPPTRRKSAPSPRPSALTPLPAVDSPEDANNVGNDEELFNPPSRPPHEDPPPSIPPKLLTKLLHTHFSDDGMRIGKDANAVVGKYFETFVREAIARAAFERAEAVGSAGGRGDGFLAVEDLEKLAPQLLLDF